MAIKFAVRGVTQDLRSAGGLGLGRAPRLDTIKTKYSYLNFKFLLLCKKSWLSEGRFGVAVLHDKRTGNKMSLTGQLTAVPALSPVTHVVWPMQETASHPSIL